MWCAHRCTPLIARYHDYDHDHVHFLVHRSHFRCDAHVPKLFNLRRLFATTVFNIIRAMISVGLAPFIASWKRFRDLRRDHHLRVGFGARSTIASMSLRSLFTQHGACWEHAGVISCLLKSSAHHCDHDLADISSIMIKNDRIDLIVFWVNAHY